jgi:SAM-dependent methyltransferase
VQADAGVVSTDQATVSKWPKTFPPLTAEQKRISDDFMKYWHEVLPRKFGVIEKFNHGYPVRHAPANFKRTLEIGAGLGEHVVFEKLTPEQEANYHAVELRQNMTDALQERFPRIKAVTSDCQQRLDFPDGYFDRILAVHVLEHLPNLPAAVREMHRLCDRQTGVFTVVIPCEGSLAYTLARRISAQRIFEKRYKQSYKWFIEREHINRPHEILEELSPYFTIEQRSFFPLPLPLVATNLVIGLTLRPRRSD